MKDLQISLENIKMATQEFSQKNCVASGRDWKVYKGELSDANAGRTAIVAKRWIRKFSRVNYQFQTELDSLFNCKHENIIGLAGYCNEPDETIIVYKHAWNGRLDEHLNNVKLTWIKRLQICINVARGLEFLHGGGVTLKKLVHGNIKSASILLTSDWKAKISNLEFSSLGSIHQQIEHVSDNSYGTFGYLDPKYAKSGILTDKSDIYSFGVILFEMLCGRLAWEEGCEDHSQSLGPLAKRRYEEGKLDEMVFKGIKQQIVPQSLVTFSNVAYQCLGVDGNKRPEASEVVIQLREALASQEDKEIWEPKLPRNYKEIIDKSETPGIYSNTKKKDIHRMLSEGIFLLDRKVLLSLNKDGKAKEMISATMFSYEKCWSSKWKVLENSTSYSLFGTVAKILNTQNLKIPIKIKTQFLSLGIIYGAYLVFKFCDPKLVSSKPYVDLKYKIASGELNSYIAERRDGEWMMIELCRFRSDNQIFDFEVQLESLWGHPCGNGPIFIDGIEFRPIDNAAHEESVGRFINAESSVNQDQQSPSDFQEIMKRSLYDVSTMTKQELDKLLSTGVLIDNGEKLFLLSKVNSKKCHMLPAKAVINKSPDAKFTKCPSSTMSRFEEVVELQRHQAFSINCNIETKMLSPDTVYACYLVFQLPENSEGLKCPVKARNLLNKNNKESTIIYLKAPGPVDLYRDKRVPDRREDGWMEVRVWEFVYKKEIKDIPMELKLACLGGTMSGLTVCSIEFRPL